MRPDFTYTLLFLGFLCLETLTICSCNDTNVSVIACVERERQALLKFKQSLTDPSGRLSSWHGRDCCTWAGITCQRKHGFVIEVDLHGKLFGDDELPLGGEINPSLLQLKHLLTLDLSNNNFNGTPLPAFIGSIHQLERLDLTSAKFGGSLPPQLGQLSKLRYLYLSSNHFNGTIPTSLGNLSNLLFLSLLRNSWEGVVSEAHFSNLTKLYMLGLSSVKFDVSTNWIPPFKAKFIMLYNCQVGPQFPLWIRSQERRLSNLKLPDAGISSSIPDWFQNFTGLEVLDLSNNLIKGRLPFSLTSAQPSNTVLPDLYLLSLRHNHFSGPIPSNISNVMPALEYFDLAHNFINGDIPSLPPYMNNLDLSWNFIHGVIPSSLCDLKRIQFLSLANNRLSGELPRCSWEKLRYLDLGSNNLTGKVPIEIGFSRLLNFLALNKNSLSGEVPPLQELNVMVTLDIGENNFSGEMSIWIGEGLSSLQVLRLRSNSFTGHIPSKLCKLPFLQVIDLGHNVLSGPIPPCFGNLSALVKVGAEEKDITQNGSVYTYNLGDLPVIVVKGRELDYDKNLKFLRSIDLSKNNLSGKIPSELTTLLGLSILNLSMNHLTGTIPEQIGKLKQLECLDFSINHLSGSIPQSLSELNYLTRLNFSHNNLSGRIVSSNQLQTLNDLSIYQGNTQLCGAPLTKICLGDEIQTKSTVVDSGEEDETNDMWFYISMGTGFLVGLGGIWGSLLVSVTWRRAYCRYCGEMKDMVLMFLLAIRAQCLGRALCKTK